MQILINGREVSLDSSPAVSAPPLAIASAATVADLRSRLEADIRAAGHAIADFQISPARARHVREVLLCEVETLPIAEMLAPILNGMATLAKDAPELHRLAAASIRSGDDDAGELLERSLAFWGLLAESLTAAKEIGETVFETENFDTIHERLAEISDLLEAAERGEGSPLVVAGVVELLATEAETWRERLLAESSELASG